ncbi:putative nucleotidyltransferase, Ribonuclease H [Helianthus anomalus]
MKLNPEKCSFGFEEGKFLGHIVGKQSIKANPNKVKAVLEAKPPKTKKEVESLNGKLAALKRFTSKLAERSLPFYKTLKNCSDRKDFKWTEEAEEAFNQMKQHLASDETMVNRAGLTHWSRQEGLIPFSRRSLAGSPVG